jgi:hypothetical protein
MPAPSYRALLLFLLSVSLSLVSSCGGSGSKSSPAPGGSNDGSPPSAATADEADKIKIKTPDEQAVVEFKLKGDSPKIEFSASGQTKILRGELNKNDKRKYQLEGGGMVAEVKPGDDGFKVRTPDGNLLWKVKIAGDKIKISNNEENTNPFVLAIKDNDRVKILQNETLLGEVKFYRDRQKVKVKDTNEKELYESNTDRYSAMYGVMMMQQIPDAERYIIMAELLLRKR